MCVFVPDGWFVCLFVCLFVSLFVCLFVCFLFVCLLVALFVRCSVLNCFVAAVLPSWEIFLELEQQHLSTKAILEGFPSSLPSEGEGGTLIRVWCIHAKTLTSLHTCLSRPSDSSHTLDNIPAYIPVWADRRIVPTPWSNNDAAVTHKWPTTMFFRNLMFFCFMFLCFQVFVDSSSSSSSSSISSSSSSDTGSDSGST